MQAEAKFNLITHISSEIRVISHGSEVKKEQYVPLTMNALSLIAEKGLNASSVILYTLLADRSKSSLTNGYVDEEGRPFIYYTINEAMKVLQASANSIRKYFAELCDLKLIEFKDEEGVSGYRKIRRIYVNYLERVSEVKAEVAEAEKLNAKEENDIDESELLEICALVPSDVELECYPELQRENIVLNFDLEENNEEEVVLLSKENKVAQMKSESENSTFTPKQKEALEKKARVNQRHSTVDKKKSYIEGMKAYIKERSIYRQLQNMKLHIRTEKFENKDLQDLENYIATKINYAKLLEEYNPNLVDYILKLMISLFTSSYKTYFVNQQPVDINTIREEILSLEEAHIRYLLYSLQRTTTDVSYLDNYFIASLYSINENLALDRRGYFNYLAR